MLNIASTFSVFVFFAANVTNGFTSPFVNSRNSVAFATRADTSLNAEDKVARDVSGEELEIMLTEWDQPLILDAYATWCGPCVLVSFQTCIEFVLLQQVRKYIYNSIHLDLLNYQKNLVLSARKQL